MQEIVFVKEIHRFSFLRTCILALAIYAYGNKKPAATQGRPWEAAGFFITIQVPSLLCFLTKGEENASFNALQFTAGSGDTFYELFLEDQVQYDHRNTSQQGSSHQLRIVIGVLTLHLCQSC